MKLPSVVASATLAGLALLVSGCAEGTGIDDPVGDGEGDGGNGGTLASGPSGSQGTGTDATTSTGSFGSGTSTTGATTSSTTGGSTTSSGPSASAGNTTGSGVTSATGPSATSGNTTTTTGGGSMDCDPLNPGLDCGAGQQCVPLPAPSAPVCEPAGFGLPYDLCFGRDECSPSLECVNDGLDACCMAWCRVGVAGDCAPSETCTALATPPEINGVEYGVCWDGLPCVFF